MITLKDITKTYKMGETTVSALNGINLEVSNGEFVAIVGPSGSGKSTLMNIIGCLDISSGGYYSLDNIVVDNYSENELADIRNNKIGFIFQQFNLLSNLTALENVTVPMLYARVNNAKRRIIAKKLLYDVGLGDRIYHKPTELSGGEQQRVSIARALANDPDIILADEPTGALDSKTGIEVIKILKRLNETGKTIIMITHDHGIASNADRIITLRDGKIESDSKGSEV
ncbi:MAG: ABC transporter ATP-binding protein [Bacilli bacterium]|nr:ABC transporter ATP-binding protein [Bacilli bacterium]